MWIDIVAEIGKAVVREGSISMRGLRNTNWEGTDFDSEVYYLNLYFFRPVYQLCKQMYHIAGQGFDGPHTISVNKKKQKRLRKNCVRAAESHEFNQNKKNVCRGFVQGAAQSHERKQKKNK